MKVTPEKNEKVVKIIFGSIYPLYLNRLEKNERTQKEFNQVIEWLTGFDEQNIQQLVKENVSFASFFEKQTSTQRHILVLVWFVGVASREFPKTLASIALSLPR